MVTPAASAPRTPAAAPLPPPPKAEPPKAPVSSAATPSTTPAPPKAEATPPQSIDETTRADARKKAASDPHAAATAHALHAKLDAERPPSPAELQGDRRYQRLPRETRSAVLASLDRAKDGASRDNVSGLAISDGFAKMTPAEQKKALDVLAQNPTSSELRGDLAALGKDPAFTALKPAVREATLDQLGNHPGQPGAAPMTSESKWAERKVLKDLATSPGFAGLDEKEQLRMLQVHGGKNEQISAPARVELFKLTDSDAYKSATPEQQTAQLRKYSADNAQAPSGAHVPASSYDHSTPPVLTGPKEVSAPFQTGYAKADRYEMQVDGRTIPITVAKGADPKKGVNNSAQELAAGIQALPKHSRDAIKEVRIEPNANPDDAYWRTVPGYQKDHQSYMTCGADGTVRVFPMPEKQSQHTVDSSLAHETGHTLSQRRWGSDVKSKKWDEWKDAAKKDGIVASDYAKSSPAEDFSETLVLYNSVRGKPEEAEVRALMPERFAVLDKMLATP